MGKTESEHEWSEVRFRNRNISFLYGYAPCVVIAAVYAGLSTLAPCASGNLYCEQTSTFAVLVGVVILAIGLGAPLVVAMAIKFRGAVRVEGQTLFVRPGRSAVWSFEVDRRRMGFRARPNGQVNVTLYTRAWRLPVQRIEFLPPVPDPVRDLEARLG